MTRAFDRQGRTWGGEWADHGSRLMDIHGVGPVVAARILADVGDVARFAVDTEGRDYDRRSRAACKKPKEAIRCLMG